MAPGHVQQLEELSALPWAGAFRWDGSKWKSARVRGLEAVADRAGLGLAEVRFLSGLSSADDYAVEITCHGDATKRRQAVVEKLADRVFVQLLAAPDASPTDADGFDIAVRPI
jgi:hypothetical protein